MLDTLFQKQRIEFPFLDDREELLMIKANVLFPLRDYLDELSVRANRRKYVAAVKQLQHSKKWGDVYA